VGRRARQASKTEFAPSGSPRRIRIFHGASLARFIRGNGSWEYRRGTWGTATLRGSASASLHVSSSGDALVPSQIPTTWSDERHIAGAGPAPSQDDSAWRSSLGDAERFKAPRSEVCAIRSLSISSARSGIGRLGPRIFSQGLRSPRIGLLVPKQTGKPHSVKKWRNESVEKPKLSELGGTKKVYTAPKLETYGNLRSITERLGPPSHTPDPPPHYLVPSHT